jgi:hypothetical protein
MPKTLIRIYFIGFEIRSVADYLLTILFSYFFEYHEIRRKHGAGCRSRTNDLLITNQLLYQLS